MKKLILALLFIVISTSAMAEGMFNAKESGMVIATTTAFTINYYLYSEGGSHEANEDTRLSRWGKSLGVTAIYSAGSHDVNQFAANMTCSFIGVVVSEILMKEVMVFKEGDRMMVGMVWKY